MNTSQRDQQHPLAKEDRLVINQLLAVEQVGDFDLTELGRLLIRYQNFPGAKDIQRDLQQLLQKWGLTEEELFQKTRQIYAEGSLRLNKLNGEDQQDWS